MRPSYYIDGLFRQSNAADARSYLGIAAAGVNFISAGTESDAGGIVFANSNGVTFGMSNSTVTASVAAGGGALTNIKLSAGTKSDLRSDVTFSNSNGVSFGLDAAGVITATVQTNYLTTAMQSNAATISNIKLSAGTLSALRSDVTFANSNGVSFGLDAAGVITASVSTAAAGNSINFSAGTTSNNLASVIFSNSNGVSFGLNAGTITAIFSQTGAAAGTLSFYIHPPQGFASTLSFSSNDTVFAIDPFWMPLHCSFDFLRGAVSGSNASTQYVTSGASTNYSMSRFTTFKLGIYTMGTGASSSSLFSLSTFTAGATLAASIDETGSQYTRGVSYTFPASNGSTTFSGSSAFSSASIVMNETRGNINFFAGLLEMDLPWQFSLTPGAYWMMMGIQSDVSSAGDSRLANVNLRLNYAGVGQQSRLRLMFSSDLPGAIFAGGAYTTAGNVCPATIDCANIGPDSNGNPRWFWQGLRIA